MLNLYTLSYKVCVSGNSIVFYVFILWSLNHNYLFDIKGIDILKKIDNFNWIIFVAFLISLIFSYSFFLVFILLFDSFHYFL